MRLSKQIFVILKLVYFDLHLSMREEAIQLLQPRLNGKRESFKNEKALSV